MCDQDQACVHVCLCARARVSVCGGVCAHMCVSVCVCACVCLGGHVGAGIGLPPRECAACSVSSRPGA